MLYDKIMFDMDGTLIHSMPGIFKALRLMMEELQLPKRDDEYLYNLIGPPFQEGLPKFLDLHGKDIDRAIASYSHYAEALRHDAAMISLFPSVLEMIKSLFEAGALIGIVTSKSDKPAQEHIDYFGLRPYISYIQTADDNGNGEKAALLEQACKDLGRDSLVMVGDRFYDLNAAHVCGVESIGVLYGYGSEAEIRGCKPTHVAASIQELHALLSNIK